MIDSNLILHLSNLGDVFPLNINVDIQQTRNFLKMGLREVTINVGDLLKMKEQISRIEI